MTPAKKTGKPKPSIVVAGDLAVDWFETETPPRGLAKGEPVNPRNWRTFQSVIRESLPGGAWLLADLVRAATGAEIAAPPLRDLRSLPADELVHSYVELGRFPAVGGKKDDKPSVFRVRSYKGFTGPAGDHPSCYPFEARGAAVRLVVLDDAGNGFRDHEDLWPAALSMEAKPLVVVKMSRPLTAGPLFDELRKRHAERPGAGLRRRRPAPRRDQDQPAAVLGADGHGLRLADGRESRPAPAQRLRRYRRPLRRRWRHRLLELARAPSRPGSITIRRRVRTGPARSGRER